MSIGFSCHFRASGSPVQMDSAAVAAAPTCWAAVAAYQQAVAVGKQIEGKRSTELAHDYTTHHEATYSVDITMSGCHNNDYGLAVKLLSLFLEQLGVAITLYGIQKIMNYDCPDHKNEVLDHNQTIIILS